MTYTQAFLIGMFQCLAFMAGILAFRGNNRWRDVAGRQPFCCAEFSFLLAVPMMLGATALDFIKVTAF